MKIRVLVIASALLLTTMATPTIRASSPGGVDAGAALDRLKTLAGDWMAEGSADHDRVSYTVVAGGATVLERDTGDGRPEMVTLYHRDGNRLLLTHYCMAGNQPRMQAQTYDAAARELRFEFLDATNMSSPQAGHMHSVAIRFVDDDHIETTWRFVENGQTKMNEHERYTRVH
jgi:hypothetical protein